MLKYTIIQYIILFLSSFLIALLITPFLQKAATKNGVLDYPNERKIHTLAVPRLGGISVAISFFLSIAIAYMFFRSELRDSMVYLAGLSIGSIIICLVGIWDDIRGLDAQGKTFGQFIAVIALLPFGFIIEELNIPFVGVVSINWQIGVLLVLFWTIGIMNAVNFIDGSDGLAAGVMITILSALFVISVVTGQMLMAIICITLAGGLLGFLRYNFPPAKMFMGDCGAMFLGFILAAVSIKILFQNPNIVASSFIPVLIFGLPIADTTWAIFRRLRSHRSPFRADSLHIHHRLINLGLTHKQVAVSLYAVSMLTVISGLVAVLIGSEIIILIISASMLTVAVIGITALSRISPVSVQHNVRVKSLTGDKATLAVHKKVTNR